MSAPEILRVVETGVYVADLDRAAAFYERLLGRPPFGRAAGRHAFFRLGETLLLLFVASQTERDARLPPHGARGAGHMALQVGAGSLPAWRARLAELEIPVLQEAAWGGGRSLYLRDPDGNLLELIERGAWFGGDGP